MHNVRPSFVVLTAAAFAFAPASTPAATPRDLQKAFEAAARDAAPGFSGFSAERGGQFFKARHGNDWSCASCHTENPLGPGRHAKTGKTIAPLAPAANSLRFTDAASVEKWFRRNCNDVLSRTCTPQEKGDVLQYLLSLK